jgi:MraZ protein
LWDEVGECGILRNMVIGEYNHTLDDKKRLSLPSKFRKEFGKKVVLTHGLDHCLFVYSTDEWKQFVEKLSTLSMGQGDSRSFTRFILGSAVETEIDKAGRILIPEFLKDFAKLKSKVVVVGVGNRAELWDERAWQTYKSGVEKKADTLADKLGEIGMI